MTKNFYLAALCILLTVGIASAQGFGPGDSSGECQFIDEDGDGFNDLAPDADGDGIPNGLDPDYVRPEDGTGSQFKFQHGKLGDQAGQTKGLGLAVAKMFVYQGEVMGKTGAKGNGYGPGDGTGDGDGPADGTGYGPGDCTKDRGHGYGPGDGTGFGVGPGDGTGYGPGDCDGTTRGSIKSKRVVRR